MGYDIHITRAGAGWYANDDCQITGEEWLTVVNEDPELKLAGYNGEYFTLWSGRSRYPDPWFDWSRGNVTTKNPDPPMIAKAIALAARLDAHVEGDDGERYLPDGKVERDGQVDDSPGMDWREW